MKYLTYLRSYLPRRLPIGMTEFETWSDRIISISGEFADRDSLRYALATMVINLGPQRSYVSDQYFVRSMYKGAANQVASQIFQIIRNKQKELEEAAKQAILQKQAEVTTSSEQGSEESVNIQ